MARTLIYLLFTVAITMVLVHILLGGFLAIPTRSQTTTNEQSFQERCATFKPQIARAKLELSERIQSGSRANLAYRDVTCGGPGHTTAVAQDVCRVTMYAETSTRSGVHLEIWLPENWSERFLVTGNGGIGGCVDYSGLTYATKHGFAAVGSNNGHNGTTGISFYNNPDVVADFAGRSLHTITKIGKEATQQFYRRSHKKSYFLGCSQGGRQGIGAADKYPSDFDGIVAGAPALDFTALISWRASFFPITGKSTSSDFIKPSVWSGLIHDAILDQCDTLDGVKDGIIEDPSVCDFNPEVLLCQKDQSANCLSKNQISVVKRVFSPLTYDDGTLIYPGMNPGSEQRAIDRLYAGKAFSDSQDWFRYVVHSDPTWDSATFITSRDARASEVLNPFNIKTFPSNLEPFRTQNGKILMYHGLQDQQITSFISSRWYDYYVRESKTSSEKMDSFLRYFRISGMFHCSSGPGAFMIGNYDSPIPFKRSHNVLAAIVDWVERDLAPDTIEGTKYINDLSSSGTAFTRKHCKYPMLNKLITAGSNPILSSTAEQWQCV